MRGEILGLPQDKLLQKHLPIMFSLIKIESQRFEDDQALKMAVLGALDWVACSTCPFYFCEFPFKYLSFCYLCIIWWTFEY